MKRRIKTEDSKMAAMYTLLVEFCNAVWVKMQLQETAKNNSRFMTFYLLHFEAKLSHLFDWLTQRNASDVLQNTLMSLGRLVTSNGSWFYEYAWKRVVVGLIPLKLYPKQFWKKENLVKIKKNNRKWYISSYLCLKNDLLLFRWAAMFKLGWKMNWY